MSLRTLLVPALALALQAQSPAVKILTEGPLSQAEATLKTTTDAERFALGVAQTLRALEHLGQGLHRHGSKARLVPVLRLPVPHNPNPAPISVDGLRRLLKTFQADLAKAELTLKIVKDSNFKFALPLGRVMLDLDGDGKATDRLLDLVGALRGGLPQEFEGNLEVAFDATDAAWLQGYTHLLMGLTDLLLSLDIQPYWEAIGPLLFERPILKAVQVEDDNDENNPKRESIVRFADPKALGSMRRHLLAMCALSHTTWQRAMAETDDDREWLPSPSQKGVLGVPVRREMVTAWLSMVSDLQSVLEGRLLLPNWGKDRALGFDLKAFLDNPPKSISLSQNMKQGPAARYLRKGSQINTQKFMQAMSVFGGEFMGMAIWFN
ncbi:MAG: hypothetical protein Q8O00_15805 [Holophaga sp.]|nr:hypothetical protein [Holophaga sp.]